MSRQHVQIVEHNEQARKLTNRNVNRLADESWRRTKKLKEYTADHKSVYALASVMLSAEDMSNLLGITCETLIKRFGRTIAKARGETKRKLAYVMHNKAIEQNDGRMQVWLSKQHLGYKEAWPDNVQPIAIQINIQDVPT